VLLRQRSFPFARQVRLCPVHLQDRALPRAQPFTATDIDARSEAAHAPDRLADRAGILTDRRAECLERINEAYRYYKLDLTSLAQEKPAKIVAAFTKVEKCAAELLATLDKLPPSLRIELRSGDLESVILARVRERIGYWKPHVRAWRPSERGWARRSLWHMVQAIALTRYGQVRLISGTRNHLVRNELLYLQLSKLSAARQFHLPVQQPMNRLAIPPAVRDITDASALERRAVDKYGSANSPKHQDVVAACRLARWPPQRRERIGDQCVAPRVTCQNIS
jgi:hypothetical protein